MLINCPECSKEISDKCGSCPHCGYSIIPKVMYLYKDVEYDIYPIIKTIKKTYNDNGHEIEDIIGDTFDLNNAPIIEIIKIENDIIEKYIPEKIEFCKYWTEEDKDKKIKQEQILMQQKQHFTSQPTNTPKCPTCQSTNIKKISTTSKAVSVGLFGLFSQKVKKQFCCGNCGYEW